MLIWVEGGERPALGSTSRNFYQSVQSCRPIVKGEGHGWWILQVFAPLLLFLGETFFTVCCLTCFVGPPPLQAWVKVCGQFKLSQLCRFQTGNLAGIVSFKAVVCIHYCNITKCSDCRITIGLPMDLSLSSLFEWWNEGSKIHMFWLCILLT